MKNIKTAVALSLILATFNSWGATDKSSLTCQNSALEDAKKLLSFYRDNDDRISIDKKVIPLAKIKNPQDGPKNSTFLKPGDISTKANTVCALCIIRTWILR